MDDDWVQTDETVRLIGETAQFIGEKYKLLHRSTAGVKPCENCTNYTGKLKVCGPLKRTDLDALLHHLLRLN